MSNCNVLDLKEIRRGRLPNANDLSENLTKTPLLVTKLQRLRKNLGSGDFSPTQRLKIIVKSIFLSNLALNKFFCSL